MMIHKTIKIDMTNGGSEPVVEAVQNDSCTRAVDIELLADKTAWTVPDGVKASLAYRTMDGTGGWYDTLPDGTDACSIDGNVVTVILAPQVLACAGVITAVLVLQNEALKQLSTFGFRIRVQPNPAAGEGISNAYYNLKDLGEINDAIARMQKALTNIEQSVINGGSSGGTPAAVSVHNTLPEAHPDIRDALAQLAADKADTAAVNAKIAAAIADKNQLAPEFANSIDDCTDTEKLYVLPDGYIYAYITTQAEQTSVELSDRSNYLLNTRFTGSEGATTADNGWYITNFIPVDMSLAEPLTMRFQGTPPFYTGDNGDGNISERAVFYDADQAVLGVVYSYIQKVDTGSRTAILHTLSDSDWLCDIGYVWTGTGDLAKTDYYDKIAYVRFSCNYASGYGGASPLSSVDDIPACSIQLDAQQGGGESLSAWQSTGHAFVPADYEDRIAALETLTQTQAQKIGVLEKAAEGEAAVPSYWLSQLQAQTDKIRQAVECAGRNKSAFFFYTDAHWSNNSGISPVLLEYLYRNTPVNRTFFGGDIVNAEADDRETMDYLWQWRSAVRNLRNHHSVVGNHDDGNAVNNRFDEKYVYAFLQAAEETPDIVRDDSGLYYYIDVPGEKTRYLCLDTAYQMTSDAQAAFMIEALKTTPAGWHIAAVAHIWLANDYADDGTVTIAGIDGTAAKWLDLFDAYNARESGSVIMGTEAKAYDFSVCGAKVAFCIGGHTHVDNTDYASPGGIPVIVTESDCYNTRSGLDSVEGTVTESSVNAVVADYDAGKVTVIRIGRGADVQIPIV